MAGGAYSWVNLVGSEYGTRFLSRRFFFSSDDQATGLRCGLVGIRGLSGLIGNHRWPRSWPPPDWQDAVISYPKVILIGCAWNGSRIVEWGWTHCAAKPTNKSEGKEQGCYPGGSPTACRPNSLHANTPLWPTLPAVRNKVSGCSRNPQRTRIAYRTVTADSFTKCVPGFLLPAFGVIGEREAGSPGQGCRQDQQSQPAKQAGPALPACWRQSLGQPTVRSAGRR
jgi:hypothetical protein